MGACLLAIDQGTTGTTCLVLRMQADGGTQVLGQGYCELPQHFAQPGWVEHDLNAIWQGVCTALGQALAAAKCRGEDIAAIGIANQRETVGLGRQVGERVYAKVSWL